MGLDFGDKTIGVSVSVNGRVATGITTIKRSGEEAFRPAMKQLKKIIAHYGVTHIVVGEPKHMDGSEGIRCEKTRLFQEKLTRYFKSIPVHLWDERLSTKAVSWAFEGRRQHYKKRVDEMAAVYILQGYLDYIRRNKMSTNEHEPIAWDEPDDDPDDNDDIVLYDEDGEELSLQILASKQDETGMYVLAAEGDEEDVALFKLTPNGDEEVIFEMVDEDHDEFQHVFNLFKDDYESLGIDIV